MSTHPPFGMPDPSVIGFAPGDGGYAVPPECATLDQRSGMRDAGWARPGVAFGILGAISVAVMISRPADLVAPVPYTGADAPLAASAVRRYDEDRAKPFNSGYSASSSSPASQ
jgi:hypothetical protein